MRRGATFSRALVLEREGRGGLADLAQRITPVSPSMASREARSRPSPAGYAH
jgi:hypothetical protein